MDEIKHLEWIERCESESEKMGLWIQRWEAMDRWEGWKDPMSLVGVFESEVVRNKAKWKFMILAVTRHRHY